MMRSHLAISLALLLTGIGVLNAQKSTCTVMGKITNDNGKVLDLVGIKLNQTNLAYTNKYGEFELSLTKNKSYSLSTSHLAYESYVTQIKTSDHDTLYLLIHLKEKNTLLETVDVYAFNKPETLVGKPNYGIYDFDFYEDKLILLTARKNLNAAEIKLSDYSGKEYMSIPVPESAGEARSFFHDYLGYTDLLCKDSVFRIEVSGPVFILTGLSRSEFEQQLKPVNDTANGHLYFNNQNPDYPKFSYFSIAAGKPNVYQLLCTVENKELMERYNWEYYFLPSRLQLEARRIAADHKVDKKIVAAAMSGFTRSMFYEPLYAPLFVVKDTICLFNHYNDYVFHYDSENKLIDSVKIAYHHPKNWHTWKRQLYLDDSESKVYALFKNGAHVSIKRINHQTGKIEGVHKFSNVTAEKIKIKDGYAYYIYRPFESTQEKFLYREVVRIVTE